MSTGIPTVQSAPFVIRVGSRARVMIQVLDCDGNLVDASSLTLTVLRGTCELYSEDFFQTYILPRQHRIIKVPGEFGKYYIDWGDISFVAVVTAVGGVYPTGFVGGEQLSLYLDGTNHLVTFLAGDQTLNDVVNRINAVVGPVVGQPVAFNFGGVLQLKSAKKGLSGVVGPLGTPAVLTQLGLTTGFTYGVAVTNESSCTDALTFVWTASDALHPSESTEILQAVYIMPVGFLQLLPHLRLIIDKAVKLVNEPEKCFLGYTDGMLVQYMLDGLQRINTYQPSVFFTPDNFPYRGFASILVEAGLICGVESQTLFAIDTDVTSYNDQGQSFVINHQQPLAMFLNNLTSNLDKRIPLFKLHFVNTGSVYTQVGPSFRLQSLLSAAPSGSLFRNVFLAK